MGVPSRLAARGYMSLEEEVARKRRTAFSKSKVIVKRL